MVLRREKRMVDIASWTESLKMKIKKKLSKTPEVEVDNEKPFKEDDTEEVIISIQLLKKTDN